MTAERIGITLTGADEQTPLRELDGLSRRQGVEIGLLFSANPEGRNRYPSETWLRGAVEVLRQRCSVHVCGRQARERVLGGELRWIRRAGRLQLNGPAAAEDVWRALKVIPHVVTQYAPRNPNLASLWLPGHCLLVDSSGGRGLSPEGWARPPAPLSKPVGFAGGLGPDNLAAELPRIAAVAAGTWWVDMESKLRSEDDWFSLAKARACVDLFNAWLLGAVGREEVS